VKGPAESEKNLSGGVEKNSEENSKKYCELGGRNGHFRQGVITLCGHLTLQVTGGHYHLTLQVTGVIIPWGHLDVTGNGGHYPWGHLDVTGNGGLSIRLLERKPPHLRANASVS
jgi:hypothetical protein